MHLSGERDKDASLTGWGRTLVCAVVAGAAVSLYAAAGHPALEATGRPTIEWMHFLVYLAAILLSSGMKVEMPKSDGTMAVNFPFILLGIVQLSPLQVVVLAISSVVAQSRVRVIKRFTLIQTIFNVANVTTATVLAWLTYEGSLRLVHHEVAPALAVGATVYFVANTVPLGLILALESGTPFLRQWFQEFPWYFPFYLVGAILAATADFIGAKFGWLTSMLLIPMVYTVYRAYIAQMAIIRAREQHIVETEALHLRTIEGLAMAIEAKDTNTHRHLLRVRVYVSELGKAMGLDDAQMKALVTASFLHDIGKLAIPEYILNKPGKLTPEEFDKMKIHTVVGAEILERVRFPYPVVPIVRSHHEAWDGSGYPDGLKGEEIPIGARILTAVDCFDALASERPYRRALPLDEAMAIVKKGAGSQFDPKVVRLLEERYVELEEMANQARDSMAPLHTDLVISRGLAPAAGFAPETGGRSSAEPARRPAAAVPRDCGATATPSDGGPEARDLLELILKLESSPTAREAGELLAGHLRSVVPFDCVAVYRKENELLVTEFMGGPYVHAFSGAPIPIGEGLSGWIAMNRRPIVNGNPTVEPNLVAGSGMFTTNSSALSVPLSDVNDVLLGVLTVYSSRYAEYSKEHLRNLQAIQPRFSLLLRKQREAHPVLESSSL